MPLEAFQRFRQGEATPKDSGTDLVQRILALMLISRGWRSALECR